MTTRSEILTDAEKAQVLNALPKHWDESRRLRELFVVQNDVRRFYQNEAHVTAWMSEVLIGLTEEAYNPLRRDSQNRRLKRPTTRGALKRDFEAVVDAEWQQHLHSLRTDSEYVEYHVDRMGRRRDEHPWGEDVLSCCRRWLSATPYQIWHLVDGIETAAVDRVRDELLELVVRGSGETVIIAARNTFDEAVNEFRTRHLAECEAARVAQARQDNWDDWPLGAPR